MEKQTLINAITCLTAALDAVSRTGKSENMEKVAKKLLELIEQL